MILRILSHHASKSVKGFDLCACLRKKNKVWHFTSPTNALNGVNGFFTQLGTNVPLVDLINCDKFCDNLFKGLNFTEVKILNFPIGIWRRLYNSTALPRSLWCRIVIIIIIFICIRPTTRSIENTMKIKWIKRRKRIANALRFWAFIWLCSWK